ncbi:unnamed protein product [Enterobius vermicularis]|uniref:Histone domain-containing protein n=1 Tax=Enterobius vermicularis TaxID=51028 RepID=A0A0N4UYG4_ENTVE|nr:unnamed protein product [Enterobius vermicularis]
MTGVEDVEILLETFGKMMYVFGDEAEPLLKCKVFVASTVREQLRNMLRQASVTASYRKSDRIEIVDVVFLFRRHYKQLNRMFQYLQSADMAKVYARFATTVAADPPLPETTLVLDDPEDEVDLFVYGKQ